MQSTRTQMVPRARELHAFSGEIAQVNLRAIRFAALVSDLPGFQNLLYGTQQAIRVIQHELVEFLPLLFFHLAPLQRFEVQPNRGDRRLQLVSDRVDETAVLLVQPYFADKKRGVQNHSQNNRGEDNHAEE